MTIQGTESVHQQRLDIGRAGELTEQEIQELVARCPEEQRWAFEGWLRGVRHLDGDPIERLPE